MDVQLSTIRENISGHLQQIDILRKEEGKIISQIYKKCDHE